MLAEWMSNVETIACDMNADFECAFLKRFLHLDIVYDCFHIVKNFNEKVICKVRKDKQARLKEQGPSSTPHTSLSPVPTPGRGRIAMHAPARSSQGEAPSSASRRPCRREGPGSATRSSYPKTSCLLPATS
ncbi:transposase [Atopobium sp. oral taxon 416]|nr:transposase [Atopobium sp. oral taxon 416]